MVNVQKQDALSRRDFIKLSAGTGAGLIVSIYLSGCQTDTPPTTALPTATNPPGTEPTATLEPTVAPLTADLDEANGPFIPSAFLQIAPDGQVTITVHRVEMGQGVRTALAMAAAEELEADWSRVRVVQSDADVQYGSQATGGSQSMNQAYMTFRRAGAAARIALIAAAAEAWNVDEETCSAREGEVIHQPSGSRLSFGDLVGSVSRLDVLSGPPLKSDADFPPDWDAYATGGRTRFRDRARDLRDGCGCAEHAACCRRSCADLWRAGRRR